MVEWRVGEFEADIAEQPACEIRELVTHSQFQCLAHDVALLRQIGAMEDLRLVDQPLRLA